MQTYKWMLHSHPAVPPGKLCLSAVSPSFPTLQTNRNVVALDLSLNDIDEAGAELLSLGLQVRQ
jgi:hypothetical protein